MIDRLGAAWNWTGWATGLSAGLLILYAILLRFRFRPRSILFLLGVVLIWLALGSPLAVLADHYLFTAHVVQNLILLMAAPELLLLGTPTLPAPARNGLVRIPIASAVLGWIAGMGVLAVWHIPALFNTALQSESVHVAQQLSLLAAGLLFWWPVLSPWKRQRMPPVPWSAIYLLAGCIGVSFVSLAVTFTRFGAYQSYLIPKDTLGILPLVRDTWRLTFETDQETAGMFLWIGGCMVYAVTTMGLFVAWYNSSEMREEFTSKQAPVSTSAPQDR